MNGFLSIFGDKAPSMIIVYRWCSEFNHERSSLQDKFRKGSPKSAVYIKTSEIETWALVNHHIFNIASTSDCQKICSCWITHNLSIAVL